MIYHVQVVIFLILMCQARISADRSPNKILLLPQLCAGGMGGYTPWLLRDKTPWSLFKCHAGSLHPAINGWQVEDKAR